jgi:hypothetical protein
MAGKKVYFIHPSVTYHTRTERTCHRLIKSKLEKDIKIITPSELSKKQIKNWKEDIKETDSVVGMALEGNYTISIWTVLEYAEKLKKPIYTICVGEGGIKWREGILEDVKKLSLEETRKFSRKVALDDGKSMMRGMIFGRRSKY